MKVMRCPACKSPRLERISDLSLHFKSGEYIELYACLNVDCCNIMYKKLNV